jgi:hypothetical protein
MAAGRPASLVLAGKLGSPAVEKMVAGQVSG